MTVADVFVRIQHALEQAGIPYMITGSFASSVRGEPRASKDVVRTQGDHLDIRYVERWVRELELGQQWQKVRPGCGR